MLCPECNGQLLEHGSGGWRLCEACRMMARPESDGPPPVVRCPDRGHRIRS